MFEARPDRLACTEPFRGYGVAVTLGADGPCALIGGYGDANRLLTHHNGRLRDVATPAVADPDRHALGVLAADLDADGREELYVHNADRFVGECADADLLLDPVGHYPDEQAAQWRDLFGLGDNVDRDNFRSGRSLAAIDRYGTGRYSVFVACYGDRSRLYEVGEDDQVSDMAEDTGLDVKARACSTLAGPLVSDRTDLYLGVEDGPNRLFRNVGGRFVEVATSTGLEAADTNARGVTVLHDRLAVGAWEGPNRLFEPTATDGGTDYADAAPANFAAPSRVRTLVAADFDNDGREELFVNALGTENRLFRAVTPDGGPVSDDAPEECVVERIDAGAATEPRGLGTGAAVADFDGDGVLELLIVHGEIEPRSLSIYRARDPCERSLRIRPLTPQGAPARGASVTLETGRWNRKKYVCAGSGYLCQMEPTAHFGLGTATPHQLRIRWPDGRETSHDPPSPGGVHEIPHPTS